MVSELEQLAEEKFSSMEGGDGLEVLSMLGQNDDMLDFDGDIENFSGQLDSSNERQFTLSLDNNNTSYIVRCYIHSGYLCFKPTDISVTTATVTNVRSTVLAYTLPQGQIRDGFVKDIAGRGTDASDGLVVSTGSEKSVDDFVNYMMFNPTRIIGINVTSDNALQLKQDFILRKNTPFKTTETKMVRPKNFQNQDVFQDKTVTFPVDFQLDANTTLEYAVAINSTVSLTFYCGGSASVHKALDNKHRKAQNLMRTYGSKRFQKASIARKFIG